MELPSALLSYDKYDFTSFLPFLDDDDFVFVFDDSSGKWYRARAHSRGSHLLLF